MLRRGWALFVLAAVLFAPPLFIAAAPIGTYRLHLPLAVKGSWLAMRAAPTPTPGEPSAPSVTPTPSRSATPTPTVTPTPGTVTVAILQPPSGTLVGDMVGVTVTVASRYQLLGVKARADGLEADLAFISQVCSGGRCEPVFAGNVWLAGLGRGAHVLTVTATDVFSNTGQAQTTFFYDRPPGLTVLAPLDWTVARPELRVTAFCTDDGPEGCTSISVGVAAIFECHTLQAVLASGRSTIDQLVSLAAYEARPISHLTLCFRARDSAGRETFEKRLVFVESSRKLADAESVGGWILDPQPDRILFVEGLGSGRSLKILEHSSGREVIVMRDPDKTPNYGFLAPKGTIFVADQRYRYGVEGFLYDWREGALINLDRASDLKAKGNYAVWSKEGAVSRRDLVSGTNIQVAGSGGNPDVAANGDVVYAVGPFEFANIARYRDGTVTQLTSGSGRCNHNPVTDGINVVYIAREGHCTSSAQEAIVLYTPSGGTALAPPRPVSQPLTWPGPDYQLNSGWIAFTRLGTAGELQVWVRWATGRESQVSYFGSSSTIEALAPDGQVTFINDRRRYLAGPGLPPVDIGTGFIGRSFWQDGQWFVAIGRSLFRVVP